ncbi:uncharacterized protein FPRO_10106 [Fusarium proliferatum ET1]|uniref:Uncharacterized protein n=1 Tax=Fusarium proliferatum (strain ET1) TaxID=1227346 RepID=A0A1L7VQV2_FUSPR|nr:uncharacterized protein FPRO_10106 [Fusarium proliferatum ET1]CZR42803.1 uncharacterized protein FPRO_10106 [Fusarium proliferatum ET1]
MSLIAAFTSIHGVKLWLNASLALEHMNWGIHTWNCPFKIAVLSIMAYGPLNLGSVKDGYGT